MFQKVSLHSCSISKSCFEAREARKHTVSEFFKLSTITDAKDSVDNFLDISTADSDFRASLSSSGDP